jgi:hypothetical protein
MLFRMLVEPSALPYLNDKRKMDAYCSEIMKILTDEEKTYTVFAKCGTIIRTALPKVEYKTREADRLRAFTALRKPALIPSRQLSNASLAGSKPSPAFEDSASSPLRVAIKRFSCIFLLSERRALAQGQRVEFTLDDTAKGPAAHDVEVRN